MNNFLNEARQNYVAAMTLSEQIVNRQIELTFGEVLQSYAIFVGWQEKFDCKIGQAEQDGDVEQAEHFFLLKKTFAAYEVRYVDFFVDTVFDIMSYFKKTNPNNLSEEDNKAAEIFIFSQMHQSLRSLPRRRGPSYPAEIAVRRLSDKEQFSFSDILGQFFQFVHHRVFLQKFCDRIVASSLRRKLGQNLKPQLHLFFRAFESREIIRQPAGVREAYYIDILQRKQLFKRSHRRVVVKLVRRRRAREIAAVVETEPAARRLAREEYPAPAELVDIRAVVRRVTRRVDDCEAWNFAAVAEHILRRNGQRLAVNVAEAAERGAASSNQLRRVYEMRTALRGREQLSIRGTPDEMPRAARVVEMYVRVDEIVDPGISELFKPREQLRHCARRPRLDEVVLRARLVLYEPAVAERLEAASRYRQIDFIKSREKLRTSHNITSLQ